MRIQTAWKSYVLVLILTLVGCDGQPWNDPYPYEDDGSATLFSAFTERPKHLDPARSYTAAEWPIICQIYEAPLQYHYLKRPFVLEPLTAAHLPEVHYYKADHQELSEKAGSAEVAYTDYIIQIKPGIFYQPHPAFARDETGAYRYHHLTPQEAARYHILSDFKYTGSRELLAEDYVYQIKRLAVPALSSPIFGLMSHHIEGLTELNQQLLADKHTQREPDLRPYSLVGAEVLDRYRYRIRIKGKYPQFRYWLALPFFTPVPWEASLFYAQPGFQENNISIDWYPIGTGPFQLSENNPNRRMVLTRNPLFRGEFYPKEGESSDSEQGLLQDAGRPIPMLDRVVYTLERESIPFWHKFLQGYYDIAGISSDNFASAIQFNPLGTPSVTEDLKKKDIRLQTFVSSSVFYWGFNMLDETVGGDSIRARKLRQAIALTFDLDEYISIFLNGRGVVAQGPIPPDIYGYQAQFSEHSTISSSVSLQKRKGNLELAKRLIKEAGYSEGLTLFFDAVISGDPDEIPFQAWVAEQFEKIGLRLVVRGTDYNRFQDKIRHGFAQIFFFGWSADYPDPENFLFLFYGPNGAAKYGGENTSNYQNDEFDRLFEKMRVLPDGPERYAIIGKMAKILENDHPWAGAFFPKAFQLYQGWTRITKPSSMVHNTFKYIKIDPKQREVKQRAWNQPLLWPLVISVVLILMIAISLIIGYRKKLYAVRGRI